MTTAEGLHLEGRELGLEEGRETGRRELLLRQIQLRFGKLGQRERERAQQISGPEIDRCAERILTATSFDDIFEK